MNPRITINDIIEWADSLSKLKSPNLWWFRGHSKSSWKLLPRVFRSYPSGVEQSIANHFYTRAHSLHNTLPSSDDYSGWISLMQHYGLPTRLLDWSRSLLVALFFATSSENVNKQPESACIWAINPIVFNHIQLDEAYALPINTNVVKPLIRPFLKGGEEKGTCAAVLANEIDARMQVQQSAFTIHSHRRPLEELEQNERWLQKIEIDKSSISYLAHDVKTLGITASTIYPDLNHLAKDIIRIYAPPEN
ncbi:MAG: FRG domain-containing protein [Actinobacteria bacterium]|nr:FRG domain-containing protein [Actinomycetota bacterium]